MTKRMLINATHTDELRVAITNDSILVDLDIEHPGQEQKKSNIYKGRITSIEPSLGAVFVDYGSDRHGFLPLKEVSPEYFLTPQSTESITDIDIKKALKEGQEIVVQVDKEERGTKGAALTTFITLAGCYLVLMPNNPDSGGISRRIEGEDRDQLREIIEQLPIPEGMGIIIRTAGVSRSKEELEWDLKVLLRYWEAIKQAAVARPGPYLIHQESDVIIRAVRDHLRQDISEVIIDDASAFHRAKDYIRQVRPDFLEHIKLYTDKIPLFGRFQIEKQIEAAYQREVRLSSGGSIVIDHSEALVAIDINSARATKGGNIEETALQINLEAADEIAKQLRIRDIGGLVVIDFIDMTPVRNQREVENRLRNALRLDRARIQIGRISRFGLLEMSRQRLRASLSVSSEITCPRCDGRGSIRSVESAANSLVHLIQETASRSTHSQIQVQLPIDIATYMINEKRDVIKEIETQSNVQVTVIPNNHLQSPHYHLKTSKDEHTKLTPSYKLVKVPKVESIAHKPMTPTSTVEPAIQKYLTDELQTPAPKKPQGNGLIKRLWDVMFGSEAEPKKPVSKYGKAKRPAGNTPSFARDMTDQFRNERNDRSGTDRRDNKSKRPPQQRRPDRNRPPRDNRVNREQRDHHDKDNKDRNRPRNPQHTTTEKPTAEKSMLVEKHIEKHTVETPRFETQKPMVALAVENPIDTRVEQRVEKTSEKPVEKNHMEKSTVKPIVTETPVVKTMPTETPKEKDYVPPPTPAAPENYKGLSAGKPLQQVTTKKTQE
ncbi:MAG: ribonuclease E [Gammaproteobacteria bacterium CG_4_10_14_0_8_um_filter_38_16]|nr:MAG: ribonuclease E [Gammaproteobacteria bacterium CG_4_10_14_0_8_um_filter_38_16]PJA03627.1 MAG: ribonuclease E [Gammaproteobacteria bacterium CG_4_10_14_0_2_um_filter_38_22]PJB10427.1 MAG: ribonuclease E [Gammaproteobacteria bacterium CG_4_9_14_3_um_filter_38_9]